MTQVWLHAWKDLARLRRDPWAVALWMGIPLVIGLLIALAVGDSAAPKLRARLLVHDADDTFASNLLLGAFGQGELQELIAVEMVAAEAGRERLLRGDGSALLTIPKGFGESVLNDRDCKLELLTNPAQRVLPGIVRGVLDSLVDLVGYAQRLIGPELREMAAGPGADRKTLLDVRVAAIAVSINRMAENIVQRLDPLPFELVDATPVADEAADDDKAGGPNWGLAMWPGMLLMALFFMAQGLGEDLWRERRGGTLRRAAAGPAGLVPWLLGKVLAGAVIAALVGAAGLLAGAMWFGVPLHAAWLGVPWCALCGVAMLALFWPLHCIAGSARGANVLTSALGFPLLMLGGSFFPFESMPAGFSAVGRVLPNGWLLVQLRQVLEGTWRPLPLLAGALAVIAFAAVTLPFCARRLRAAVAA